MNFGALSTKSNHKKNCLVKQLSIPKFFNNELDILFYTYLLHEMCDFTTKTRTKNKY